MKNRYKKNKLPFYENKVTTEVVIENKVSIAVCRKILKEKAKSYTDYQIEQIRDFFYKLAAITYEEYEQRKATIIIPLTENKTDNEESHYLRAS
ncbi:MAG: hypothetical protein K9G49_06215 [Taibaiella sp.]|nr:hypothetical protein [Taibaiella sp.]